MSGIHTQSRKGQQGKAQEQEQGEDSRRDSSFVGLRGTDGSQASLTRATLSGPPGRGFTIWTEMEEPVVLLPVLVVFRLMSSPRHVECRLKGGEQGPAGKVVCDVRRAVHFRKGMEIRGAYVRLDEGHGELWRYDGVLPRRPGRW